MQTAVTTLVAFDHVSTGFANYQTDISDSGIVHPRIRCDITEWGPLR